MHVSLSEKKEQKCEEQNHLKVCNWLNNPAVWKKYYGCKNTWHEVFKR